MTSSDALKPRTILMIHNRHRVRGGEDTVVSHEASLLRQHGHSVEILEVNNEDIPFATVADRISAGIGTIWSRASYHLVERSVAAMRPDLAHVHNTFNRLSPSVYWALARHRVPVATTMHNYRAVCAQGGFVREGRPCFKCLLGSPLPGLRYRCYHSYPASAAVVGMQVVHRNILRTFPDKVHAFIVPSGRGMQFFRQAGWPEQKLFYKPHFVEDPQSPGDPDPSELSKRDRIVLYVGRLSEEKGVRELLQAWRRTESDWTLAMVGRGPLEAEITQNYGDLRNVTWRGWSSRAEVLELMQRARFLIVPSLWHEPFGMVAVEALSCSTPVLAADRGGLSDIVREGSNGSLFEPTPGSIEQVLRCAFTQTDDEWVSWSKQARDNYLRCYRPEENYRRLTEIYRAAGTMAACQ